MHGLAHIIIARNERIAAQHRRSCEDRQTVRLIRVALEGLEAKAEASEIEPADVAAVLELVIKLEKGQ